MGIILDAEKVSIIKRMLILRPAMSNQEILSHFTRPGRDINPARNSEIKDGLRLADVGGLSSDFRGGY